MGQQSMMGDKKYLSACGGEIKNPERYPSAIFKGETIYFCSHACLRAFESDPEGFMAGEVEHPLDEE
jgi:YHS domain-containing protein